MYQYNLQLYNACLKWIEVRSWQGAMPQGEYILELRRAEMRIEAIVKKTQEALNQRATNTDPCLYY